VGLLLRLAGVTCFCVVLRDVRVSTLLAAAPPAVVVGVMALGVREIVGVEVGAAIALVQAGRVRAAASADKWDDPPAAGPARVLGPPDL
jgi:hypothetical protein